MQQMPGTAPARIPNAPEYLDLALLISIWQCNWTTRCMRQDAFAPIAGMTKECLHPPVIAGAVLLTLVACCLRRCPAAPPVAGDAEPPPPHDTSQRTKERWDETADVCERQNDRYLSCSAQKRSVAKPLT
jgi:hypothetical protein